MSGAFEPPHIPLRPQHGANPLASAILQPLEDLRRQYADAEALLDRLRSELADLSLRVSQPASDAPPPPVRIDVANASTDALLAFQRDLNDLPSVASVDVAGAGPDRTTLFVELNDPVAPDDDAAIVCVECGRVLREGSSPPSHGLCPDCTAQFLARGQRPPGPVTDR